MEALNKLRWDSYATPLTSVEWKPSKRSFYGSESNLVPTIDFETLHKKMVIMTLY